MSLASVTAQQSAAAAAASAAAAAAVTANASSASAASATPSTPNALTSLSSNFQDFLGLLMTQLQNQDPTSPMDTNQFTSELVQFTGVQQQINTNASLTQLIQLTQGGEMLQASSIVGKQVDVQSNQLPLQNGSAEVQYTTTSAEPVSISVYNNSGVQVQNVSLNAQSGTNTWTWNGTDSSGATMPNGTYTVAVVGANPDGSTTALPFTVVGTVTGVQSNSSGMQVDLGGLTTGFSNVQQVLGN